MSKEKKIIKLRRSMTMYPSYWERLDQIASALRFSRSRAMELMILIGSEKMTSCKTNLELRDLLESAFMNLITKLENEGRIAPPIEA